MYIMHLSLSLYIYVHVCVYIYIYIYIYMWHADITANTSISERFGRQRERDETHGSPSNYTWFVLSYNTSFVGVCFVGVCWATNLTYYILY